MAIYPSVEVLPCNESEGDGDDEGVQGGEDGEGGKDDPPHHEAGKDGQEACGESQAAARTRP